MGYFVTFYTFFNGYKSAAKRRYLADGMSVNKKRDERGGLSQLNVSLPYR